MYRVSFNSYELFITDDKFIPSIKNKDLKLLYKDKTTNITYDLYHNIFSGEGDFALAFYQLDSSNIVFNKKWTKYYTGKYKDILDIVKDCKLIIYETTSGAKE